MTVVVPDPEAETPSSAVFDAEGKILSHSIPYDPDARRQLHLTTARELLRCYMHDSRLDSDEVTAHAGVIYYSVTGSGEWVVSVVPLGQGESDETLTDHAAYIISHALVDCADSRLRGPIESTGNLSRLRVLAREVTEGTE